MKIQEMRYKIKYPNFARKQRINEISCELETVNNDKKLNLVNNV